MNKSELSSNFNYKLTLPEYQDARIFAPSN